MFLITYFFFQFAHLFKGAELDETKLQPIVDAFEVLEKYLETSEWVAGENMTIADIAIAVTVSQAEVSLYSARQRCFCWCA